MLESRAIRARTLEGVSNEARQPITTLQKPSKVGPRLILIIARY
jgi:hypothetical protein